MKQFRTLLLLGALFLGAFTTNAQSKVAHIDVQVLIQELPAMKNAQTELQKVQKSYTADIETMYAEYQGKVKLYTEQAQTVTTEENAKRAKEVQGMEQSIQQFQANAQQELQKKEIDLIKPIMENARLAIQKVSRALGYQYVLDSSTGSGVILSDGKDLMNDVKKELGM